MRAPPAVLAGSPEHNDSAEQTCIAEKHGGAAQTGVCCVIAERMPGGIKLARTPMAASRLSLGGSPLHPSSPTLHATALPITFQVCSLQEIKRHETLPLA